MRVVSLPVRFLVTSNWISCDLFLPKATKEIRWHESERRPPSEARNTIAHLILCFTKPGLFSVAISSPLNRK